MTQRIVKTYKIIRFRAHGANTVERTGLTREEAEEHCEREDTHGDGWFDGWEVENPTADELRERAESDAQLRDACYQIEDLLR